MLKATSSCIAGFLGPLVSPSRRPQAGPPTFDVLSETRESGNISKFQFSDVSQRLEDTAQQVGTCF
jgi:hypothetical protein